MIVAIFACLAGMICLGVILGARYSDILSWRKSLVAFRIILPSGLGIEDVARWLSNVAAGTHPAELSLLPMPPVAIEIVSSTDGIAHYLLVTEHSQGKLLAGLRATLPGARLEDAPEYFRSCQPLRLAAEAIVTSRVRPMAAKRAEATATALLASLQPISSNCQVRYQFIMTSAGTPDRISPPKEVKHGWTSWWEGALPHDAEAVQAARLKQEEPLLQAVLRVGVSAPSDAQARKLFGRVWPVLHTLNAPSVRLRRRWLPSRLVVDQMTRRMYPITKWPLLLNISEAAAFAGFLVGETVLPGLPHGTARQMPPRPSMPSRGLVLATSNYPGLADRNLALRTSDRLRHMFVLGPTGSGKSWLLTRMILQDIASGHGVVVIDPKGDLITDVLARVAGRDSRRIVVLDASRRDQPIGFNILADSHTEEARELTVDAVLHVFKEIWSAFWGPRTDQVMRAALSTLVHASGADGSAMTLCELMPLLTQPAFRRFVTGQPSIPPLLRSFWQWYDELSDAARLQAIGPVSNKVDAFTGRTPIRLMLGQSASVNFNSIFREQKALLISLAKGTLGSETASLLGALMVSSLWHTTQGQVRIPADRRRSAFAYIDEAADIMRLPIGLEDMLAQARGLGLGIVAATQLIAQVPDSVKAAFLGTIRTQLTFAVEHDDAGVLARRFSPLSADDLINLGPYEVALRPCLDGTTAMPVTGRTLPLDDPLQDPDALAAASRKRYGKPRADVEAAIQDRQTTGRTGPGGGFSFGRERTGDKK